jgi:flagellar biosynthesis/type III secretory pathway protein FliH
MIIKKVKLPKDKQTEGGKAKPNPNQARAPRPVDSGPRPERRRGDRRRGYRRIDDRNLVSRAHEEANMIKEVSSREGFEYGLEKAQEQLVELSTAMTELLTARDKAMQCAMNDIAQMAVLVAEKLIKQEVAADPDIVLTITAETIKEMGKGHTSIIIKVNPADLNLVKENLPKLYPYGDSKTNIVVLEEETVEWGSCIVETNTGVIDASFSTQLAILKKALEIGI